MKIVRKKVIIFDTTLRDGEQALQASLTVKEKIQIARALERMGVDVMEVGFPVSSPGEFQSVQTIASKIKNSRICVLARCVDKDIDVAAEALRRAYFFRIHVFLATSNIHMESKLKRSFNEVLEMIVRSIKRARNYTDDVEFSCEDAGRTSIDHLCRVVEASINAGATTINIPDTVGYTNPTQFGRIITTLYEFVPNIHKAIISVHCHDDLGMATGNSITALQAGARQIEGTLNGIGERAGNCSLEEVIMAIKIRKDMVNVHTNINHKEIYRTSKIVSQLCKMPIQANKAIVGSNAFTHSSGIHQDGVLKNRENYEIIMPNSIGLKNVPLNLTSRSGRAAIKKRMEQMSYSEKDYNLEDLYNNFLNMADKKGQVFDYDLEYLVFLNKKEKMDYFKLIYFSIQSGRSIIHTASVKVICGKKEINEAATGKGPIDAVYQAIHRITKCPIDLVKYQLTTKGYDWSQVEIIVSYNKRNFHGIGLAKDIIESSAKAMMHVLNNIFRSKKVEKKLRNKNNQEKIST